MPKAAFPERSAHLSYVAPLIGVLLVQQLGTRPVSLAVVAVLVLGGLFSAVTGLRWSRRERGAISKAAVIGLVANLVFAAGVLWSAVGRPAT